MAPSVSGVQVWEVILVPYSAEWPAAFQALASVLAQRLGTTAVAIEHVGSTAVPELWAKPILDIDVVIGERGSFPEATRALADLGYAHEGDLGITGREAFKRTDEQVPWTEPRRAWMAHHLYVCPSDSRELRRHLAFRDAMRARPELRLEYQRRKLALAERAAGDRSTYVDLKEVECRSFIERIINEPGR